MSRFELVAFDADDTLWHSEDGFRHNELQFVELVSPYAPVGVDVKAALTAVERTNLATLGYGVKAFAISMVEAAITISGGTVPTAVIAELVDNAKAQLREPVRLLPDVGAVLAKVASTHKLALITKGDLIHQTHKIATSGLAHYFTHVEVVLEKDPQTYANLLNRFGVEPERFCMIGNSVRSDILPVMALGGTGVHVPYPLLWDLEHVDHDEHVVELAALTDVPAWLANNG
ncbi:MAG TPA: HAD family hydrolase [Ilumatobacteraceae bacterium]|nr:HAD family hydrolase [Ilumatobacteraceae bacterium]